MNYISGCWILYEFQLLKTGNLFTLGDKEFVHITKEDQPSVLKEGFYCIVRRYCIDCLKTTNY